MNRTRALLVSLAIGVAAVTAVFALGRTLTLGQQARSASDTQIVQRSAQLDRYEASLQRALRQKTPALPALPSRSPASTAAAGSPARVVYRRPAPVVVVARHHDDEHELAGAEADD
jgi:hypothetical protein